MKRKLTIPPDPLKVSTQYIAGWVGDEPERFGNLFKLCLGDEYRVVQHAAAALTRCLKHHPGLIQPHFGQIVTHLKMPEVSVAVKRNLLRLIQDTPVPARYEGDIMTLCFGYLQSSAEPVAIKAFSIRLLGHLCKKYPDIIPEVKSIIEDQWPHQSAAFRSRGKWFLKMAGSPT